MELVKLVSEFDVRSWINESLQKKYSLNQICAKFNLDIENDRLNKVFWNINITKKVVITPELLNYLGYSGTYHHQKINLMRLLNKNQHITYVELADENDFRKKYIVMSGLDLESLMMQMRTRKVYELHMLFSLMKMIVVKYCEYEKYFAKHHAHILACQNSTMLSTMHEMKRVILSERQNAADEMKRLEQEYYATAEEKKRLEHENNHLEHQRLLAIDERNHFEYERNRLEHEWYLAVEEKKRLEYDRHNLEMALKQAEHLALEREQDAELAKRLAIEREQEAEYVIKTTLERGQKTASQKPHKLRNLGKFLLLTIMFAHLLIFSSNYRTTTDQRQMDMVLDVS